MTEQVLDRQQKHRLAVLRHAEEITGKRCCYLPLLRHQQVAVLHLAAPLRG
jgi:hypothetical protein